MATVVRDIMDTEPATVRPETPVEEVVRTLRSHELGLTGLSGGTNPTTGLGTSR